MYASKEDYDAVREVYYNTRHRETMGIIGGICLLAFFAIIAGLALWQWIAC